MVGEAKDTLIVLAEGLGKGEHEVILQKRTEGEQGRFTVHSFLSEGELLQANGRKNRHIEFIGDSITEGVLIDVDYDTKPANVVDQHNRRYQDGWFQALREYFMCTAARRTSSAASNCIGCGKCEKHCPQGIQIRQELKNAKRELEVPVYKVARTMVKWLKLYG